MKSQEFFSPAVARQCESALNSVPVLGVGLGSTLEYLFNNTFLRGTEDWSYYTFYRDLLLCTQPLLRPLFPPYSRPDTRESTIGLEGQLLVTAMTARSTSMEMIMPIVEKFGPDRCVVVGTEDEVAQRLPKGVGFFRWDKLVSHAYDQRKWLDAAGGDLLNLMRRGKNFFEKQGIPWRFFPTLCRWILIQSQRVFALKDVLSQSRPLAILTPYDRSYYASCLVLAARTMDIPTATLIHGAINPGYGYVPVLSDAVFAWGSLMERQLLERGVPSEKISVVGCQHRTRGIAATRDAARKKTGMAGETRVALMAPSIERPGVLEAMIEALGNSCRRCPGWLGVVRLHPSQRMSRALEALAERAGVIVMENNWWTQDEALAAADLVLVRDSNFGTDALIKKKPVVVFRLGNSPLLFGQILVDDGGCPLLKNEDDLVRILKGIDAGNWPPPEVNERWEEYAHNMCVCFGDEATTRIVSALRDLAGRIEGQIPRRSH